MKRRLIAALVLAAPGWLLTGAGAAASPPDEAVDVDTVVVSGPASVSPSVAVVGGTGNFSFSASQCVLLSAGAPASEPGEGNDIEASAPSACTTSASGFYSNVVCGTGIAAGSGTIAEGSGSDSYAVQSFQVVFVAGVGVLTGVVTESEPDGAGTAGAQPLYGLVVLVQSVPPPVAACTDKFTATAVLSTTA